MDDVHVQEKFWECVYDRDGSGVIDAGREGADPNAVDDDGLTAAEWTIFACFIHGDVEKTCRMIKDLQWAGADVGAAFVELVHRFLCDEMWDEDKAKCGIVLDFDESVEAVRRILAMHDERDLSGPGRNVFRIFYGDEGNEGLFEALCDVFYRMRLDIPGGITVLVHEHGDESLSELLVSKALEQQDETLFLELVQTGMDVNERVGHGPSLFQRVLGEALENLCTDDYVRFLEILFERGSVKVDKEEIETIEEWRDGIGDGEITDRDRRILKLFAPWLEARAVGSESASDGGDDGGGDLLI